MQAVAHAQAKLILFGEHAAVYGFPAVGTSLPWKTTTTVSPAETPQWSSSSLSPDQGSFLSKLLSLVYEDHSLPPLRFTFQTDVPLGVGFGSSGALCVSLTRALFSFLNRDDVDIWKYAHGLERIFHSTPSGIDTGLSVFEKLCCFNYREGELPRHRPLKSQNLFLILGAVPRITSTGALVSGLRESKANNPLISAYLQNLGLLAEEAIKALSSSSVDKHKDLGKHANDAHHLLAKLNLSTPEMDHMIHYGISLGAAGGKLSGAGGGGAYFLIAETQGQAQEVAHQLSNYAVTKKIPHILLPSPLLI